MKTKITIRTSNKQTIALIITILIGLLLMIPSAIASEFVVDPSLKSRGLYNKTTDTITVRNLNDKWAIAHETGHSKEINFPDCKPYLTMYARKSIEEDKAESYAFFSFHRELFRKRAARNKCLMLKYRAIYRSFYPTNN